MKAQQSKYDKKIHSPVDVFVVVQDIVGTRMTCNTRNDAYAVFQRLKEVASRSDAAFRVVGTESDYCDDYIKKPKESGYRALSLLLWVPATFGTKKEDVVCEVQIRTLLQHAWGELTHEDTYKPGMSIPNFYPRLSRRLADALSVLDELAQDIRDEIVSYEVDAADGASGRSEAEVEDDDREQQDARPATLFSMLDLLRSPQVDWEMVRSAYAEVFGDDPDVQDKEYLMSKFRSALYGGAGEPSHRISLAFKELKRIVEDFTVDVTPPERILGAAAFVGRPGSARVLVDVINRYRSDQDFIDEYQEGKHFLGSVVFVGPGYGLIQLPEGDTGIIHWRGIQTFPGQRVDIHDYLRVGETIPVKVSKAMLYPKRRIELQLVRDED